MMDHRNDIVVCVGLEENYPELKIGRKFKVIDQGKCSPPNSPVYKHLYKLTTCDTGEEINWVDADLFKTITELREEKLNYILTNGHTGIKK